MNVTIISSDRLERQRCAELLRSRGHRVSTSSATGQVEAAVERHRPDLAVVDWDTPGVDSPGLLATVRKAMRRRSVYVVALVARTGNDQITEAVEAGADDFVRKSCASQEFIARCDTLPNRRGLGTQSQGEAEGFSVDFSLDDIRAWRGLGEASAKELGDMLGIELRLTELDVRPVTVANAVISVSLPAEKVEVQMALGLAQPWMDALGDAVFGGPVPLEVGEDALREMANTVGGAFKRQAMGDGALFTLGLPQSPRSVTVADSARTWVLQGDNGVRIMLSVAEAALEATRVEARNLQEGMVLARDVRAGNGVVLVTSGTVLTRRSVQRLVELVGATALLEVGDPSQRKSA